MGHAASEADIYLTPYMDLLPGSLFVAVTDGMLTGYLTGCPDSSLFPSEDERITAAVRKHRLILRPGPVRFFARSLLDVAGAKVRRQELAGELDDRRWPAHLHINVVAEVRGTGVAPALMHAWLDQLRAMASPGCYLQTVVENGRAVRFFERMGFRRHGPTAIVPGLRHQGAKVGQLTMVWTSDRS